MPSPKEVPTPSPAPTGRDEMDPHLRWLLEAVAAGARRHDSFEIQRHFDVTPAQAVALGAQLHELAGRNRPVTVVVVERVADGRLAMPTFS